jgi:TonB family protein
MLPMDARVWIPLVLGLAVGAPVAAQTGCLAVPSQPSRPQRPSEAGRDSLRWAVRDSLLTNLRDAAPAAGVAEPEGIVFAELRDRRTGDARTWSFRSNVDAAVVRAVFARRAPLLARLPPSEDLIHLRLDEVEPPDTVTMECMPSLLNVQEFQQDLRRISARRTATPGGPARVALNIKMLVTRDGEVAYAELGRRSSDGDVDRAVLEAARRLRFRPAMIVNVPVDVWVEQAVEVQVGAP